LEIIPQPMISDNERVRPDAIIKIIDLLIEIKEKIVVQGILQLRNIEVKISDVANYSSVKYGTNIAKL